MICSQSYKGFTIVNYNCRKFYSHVDYTRVIIYDCRACIRLSTGASNKFNNFLFEMAICKWVKRSTKAEETSLSQTNKGEATPTHPTPSRCAPPSSTAWGATVSWPNFSPEMISAACPWLHPYLPTNVDENSFTFYKLCVSRLRSLSLSHTYLHTLSVCLSLSLPITHKRTKKSTR